MCASPAHPPPTLAALRLLRRLLACGFALLLLMQAGAARADDGPADEYRLKAAFLFNFATFTTWPEAGGDALAVCVYGDDPFGAHLDAITGRKVGERGLRVQRVSSVDALDDCQMVFVARSVIGNLARVLDRLDGRPVLTVADSPGAMENGVMLNMDKHAGRIGFSANLAAARRQGLALSARLLNLAIEIKQ